MKKLLLLFSLLFVVTVLEGSQQNQIQGHVSYTCHLPNATAFYCIKLESIKNVLVLAVPASTHFSAQEGDDIELRIQTRGPFGVLGNTIEKVKGIRRLDDHYGWSSCSVLGFAAEGSKPWKLASATRTSENQCIIHGFPGWRSNSWYAPRLITYDEFCTFASIGDELMRINDYARGQEWDRYWTLANIEHRFVNVTRGTLSKPIGKGLAGLGPQSGLVSSDDYG